MPLETRPSPEMHRRWRRIKRLRSLGLKVVGAVGCLALGKDVLAAAARGLAGFSSPIAVFTAVALVAVIGLFFFWEDATENELEMLEENLAEYAPIAPREFVVAILFLSGLLVALAMTVDWSAIYAGVLLLFKAGEIWGIRLRNSRLAPMIERARTTADPNALRILDALSKYYFTRPQIELAATIGFFACIGTVLGVMGALYPNAELRVVFTCASYGVTVVAMVVNEIVYFRWRSERGRALNER